MKTTSRICSGCNKDRLLSCFSRKQMTKEHATCRDCVASNLLITANNEHTGKSKRCIQCFQDVPKDFFSKRQYRQVNGKCTKCVQQLERDASKLNAQMNGKWSYDCYYRCCYRGKNGGVGIRSKCNIASPLVGCIPLGRVFRASCAIYNELGDAMVKIDPLSCPDLIAEKKAREGWIPCRSIRNEIFIEAHSGPWRNAHAYYRCVIEGCKVRAAPDLSLSEIGYVLYGDVLQVIECTVGVDGIAMLRLHDQYFDGPAWVVERTLDNESVLNRVENPFAPNTKSLSYRCVQDNGAPLRTEPSLNSPPISRLPCGAVVSIVERLITPERQVFLRLARITSHNVEDTDLWVIETSTVCASVMVPCRDSCIVNSTII